MSAFLELVVNLILRGDVKISSHGYDELAEDNIFVKDIIENVRDAKVVEQYLDYPKGSCVLVLQKDTEGNPIHVVWGIPKGSTKPAVLVTAYRPNTDIWSKNFMRRKK